MNPQGTLREQLEQKYKMARANLALMIVLSIVNIIMLVAGSTSMLLFSATVPYVAGIYAMTAVEYGLDANMIVFVICVAIAAISVLLYALCWWQSKKRSGFMIAALVLFILDTAFMAYMYLSMLDVSGIIDIAIHAWVIYYLVIGVTSGAKLKKLPEEPPVETIPAENNVLTQETAPTENEMPTEDAVPAQIVSDEQPQE